MLGLKKSDSGAGAIQSPFNHMTGEFQSIDLAAAKKNLQLADRAADDGKNNIPPASSSKKDAAAAEIDSYLSNRILLAKNAVADRLQAMDELSRNQMESSIGAITEIYENGKVTLKGTAEKYYGELFLARNDWILGEKQITDFRKEHARPGPAQYPEDRSMHYGLIFLITIIEILTNAYALGDAHPSGPLGVIVEIFMFGIINVGFAFLLGMYVWRWFYHKSAAFKFGAYALGAVLMAFLAFINLLLAHYRDAITRISASDLGAADASFQRLGLEAINGVFSGSFYLLSDFKSYLLLFVGLFAAIVATKKAFDLDDPYPGYGKLARNREILAKKFVKNQANYKDDLSDLVDDYSQQIRGQLELLKGHDKGVVDREKDRAWLMEKYNSWLSAVEKTGKALYAFYRGENMKHRKDGAEPVCFSRYDYNLPKEAEITVSKTNRPASQIKEAEKKCEGYLAELNGNLAKYLKAFTGIEEMSPDKVLNESNKEPTVFKD